MKQKINSFWAPVKNNKPLKSKVISYILPKTSAPMFTNMNVRNVNINIKMRNTSSLKEVQFVNNSKIGLKNPGKNTNTSFLPKSSSSSSSPFMFSKIKVVNTFLPKVANKIKETRLKEYNFKNYNFKEPRAKESRFKEVQFINNSKLGKKVPKKEMNWVQAQIRYPKLNPYGDADRDGVMNMYDCKPFDKMFQEEITKGNKTFKGIPEETIKKVSEEAKKEYLKKEKEKKEKKLLTPSQIAYNRRTEADYQAAQAAKAAGIQSTQPTYNYFPEAAPTPEESGAPIPSPFVSKKIGYTKKEIELLNKKDSAQGKKPVNYYKKGIKLNNEKVTEAISMSELTNTIANNPKETKNVAKSKKGEKQVSNLFIRETPQQKALREKTMEGDKQLLNAMGQETPQQKAAREKIMENDKKLMNALGQETLQQKALREKTMESDKQKKTKNRSGMVPLKEIMAEVGKSQMKYDKEGRLIIQSPTPTQAPTSSTSRTGQTTVYGTKPKEENIGIKIKLPTIKKELTYEDMTNYEGMDTIQKTESGEFINVIPQETITKLIKAESELKKAEAELKKAKKEPPAITRKQNLMILKSIEKEPRPTPRDKSKDLDLTKPGALEGRVIMRDIPSSSIKQETRQEIKQETKQETIPKVNAVFTPGPSKVQIMKTQASLEKARIKAEADILKGNIKLGIASAKDKTAATTLKIMQLKLQRKPVKFQTQESIYEKSVARYKKLNEDVKTRIENEKFAKEVKESFEALRKNPDPLTFQRGTVSSGKEIEGKVLDVRNITEKDVLNKQAKIKEKEHLFDMAKDASRKRMQDYPSTTFDRKPTVIEKIKNVFTREPKEKYIDLTIKQKTPSMVEKIKSVFRREPKDKEDKPERIVVKRFTDEDYDLDRVVRTSKSQKGYLDLTDNKKAVKREKDYLDYDKPKGRDKSADVVKSISEDNVGLDESVKEKKSKEKVLEYTDFLDKESEYTDYLEKEEKVKEEKEPKEEKVKEEKEPKEEKVKEEKEPKEEKVKEEKEPKEEKVKEEKEPKEEKVKEEKEPSTNETT